MFAPVLCCPDAHITETPKFHLDVANLVFSIATECYAFYVFSGLLPDICNIYNFMLKPSYGYEP